MPLIWNLFVIKLNLFSSFGESIINPAVASIESWKDILYKIIRGFAKTINILVTNSKFNASVCLPRIFDTITKDPIIPARTAGGSAPETNTKRITKTIDKINRKISGIVSSETIKGDSFSRFKGVTEK